MTFLGRRLCDACGRDIDRDPWPHNGIYCGHCDLWTLEYALELSATALELATPPPGFNLDTPGGTNPGERAL